MLDIDKIVENEIIAKINTNIRVKTASAIVDGKQTLTFCNQKYLRLFDSVFFGDTEIEVFSNDGENVVILTDTPIERNSILNIAIPFYHRGTPRALNSEWSQISSDERDKLPAVWLLNPIDETFSLKNDVERKAEITLFILCSADLSHDVTEDLRQKNVFPMLQLAKEVQKAIDSNVKFFNRLETYKTRDYSIFGSENTNGMIKQIIDSQLSGLSMSFSLEILKGNCNC
jgi:hypothetical protein